MVQKLDGLFPPRRRSKLGPTRYVPRCKCGTPLPKRGDIQQHVGACEACSERMLVALRAGARW